MLTIKYVWFYAVVAVASVGGFGAGYMAPAMDKDLEAKLRKANEQIERIALNCAPVEKFERAPVKESTSRGF